MHMWKTTVKLKKKKRDRLEENIEEVWPWGRAKLPLSKFSLDEESNLPWTYSL